MRTKLRVLRDESDNYQISLVDDTGFQNQYNLYGYKESPEMIGYVFEVLDEIRGEVYSFEEDDVEPYMNRVVKTLEMEEPFKDSLYKVSMYSVFDVRGVGDGFEGLDFLTNVAGAETIYNNYTAIKAGEYVYQIRGQSNDALLLDREIVEDFEEFELCEVAEDNLSLMSHVENRILGSILRLVRCKCGGRKQVNKIAELQLYLYGIREAVETDNLELAKELFELLSSISNVTGGCSSC